MIQVGFIGLGHNGIGHIEAHRRVGKSEIVALCDINPECLKAASKRFGIQRTYQSADELCAQMDIEAVSINTGDQFHTEPFLSAVKNEKHVLVEKPLANSIKQVEAMIAAARAADVTLKLAVGYILRFNPMFEVVHELCHTGQLGQVYYMEGDYIHNLLYQAKQIDTFTGVNWYLEYERPIVGGGSHPLDLLRWFSGAQVVEVSGYSNHVAFPAMKQDDCQVALFRFDNGAIAKVAALYAPRIGMAPYYNLRIYGTKGTVERDQVAIAKNAEDMHPELQPIVANHIAGHPFDREVEDWLDSIRDGRSPRCNLFDGANSTVATLAAVEAMATGKALSVPVYTRS
ncbi:Gfo/Idh/MocA family oxidoreductase [Candidatus Poribacteria bacterium]|nr:Gfo/Idh/MocA family oxidoreductase [Candidatus Poribacteria bacterium]